MLKDAIKNIVTSSILVLDHGFQAHKIQGNQKVIGN